jgi:hypothetical protein
MGSVDTWVLAKRTPSTVARGSGWQGAAGFGVLQRPQVGPSIPPGCHGASWRTAKFSVSFRHHGLPLKLAVIGGFARATHTEPVPTVSFLFVYTRANQLPTRRDGTSGCRLSWLLGCAPRLRGARSWFPPCASVVYFAGPPCLFAGGSTLAQGGGRHRGGACSGPGSGGLGRVAALTGPSGHPANPQDSAVRQAKG